MTRFATGPLSFRLEDGALRDIRWNEVEAIRGIAWLVRAPDWATLPARIRDLSVRQEADRLRIDFVTETEGLATAIHIDARAQGLLRVEGRALPSADLLTNRAGFVVLHPIERVAGGWARMVHPDGRAEETRFPDLIAPWQPFMDLAAITHRVSGAEVDCELTGDVFETEDQRNWSDASFKTYSRPVALPRPYLLPAGQEVAQSVTLRFRPGPVLAPSAPAPVEGAVMPQIGLAVAPAGIATALAHVATLRQVGPQRILCHFDPTDGHGVAVLRDYARLQAAFPAEYDLEYVVASADDLGAEMAALAGALADAGLRLSSLAVSPAADWRPPASGSPQLEEVYAAARAAFPGLPLGGGTFGYFTEFNRKRPPVGLLDHVTHGTNPIVHAADDESVMQTLETIPHILRSGRAIIGDRAYRLGPTTIGMRHNPSGSRGVPNPDGRPVCKSGDDPRQSQPFAAAFTAGYAIAQAGSGVEVWVPAAFSGPRGIIAPDGTLWPAGEVVAALARMAGRTVAAKGRDWLRLEDGGGIKAQLSAPYGARLTPPPSRTQPK